MLLCAVSLCAALAFASSASAATRYASPDGSGSPASCSESDPCALDDAVEGAVLAAGDRVELAPGTYQLTDPLEIDDDVSVGGSADEPPLIFASTPGGPAIDLSASDGELHDVAVLQLASQPALRAERGIVDRVNVFSEGPSTCELGANGGTPPLIRDSVCRSGAGAVGASAVAITQSGGGSRAGALRNVTAWAGGSGGVGVSASASGGGSADIDARNVIASGAGVDIRATAGPGSNANVTLATSNFGDTDETGGGTAVVTPAGSGANQTGEPRFVNADEGFLDQRADSPTIDAGSAGTLLGSLDVHGAPRVQGDAIDIGADEHDGTAPRTSIESGPPAVVRTGRVSFTFRADDPAASFECRMDDDEWASCTSPYTSPSLLQGDHVFGVRGTDEAGNVETTPAERYFSVDKVVAGANVTARSRQRVRGRSVSLAVSVRASELAVVRAAGIVKAGKHRLRFQSRNATVISGVSRKLVLKPLKRDAARRIAKALRRGKDVEAAIQVTFTDLVGNSATTGDVDVRIGKG